MATNQKIKEDIQKLNVGSPIVQLFKLDATALGGTIYYITPGTIGGEIIYFGTVPYVPIPMEATGFEFPGDGKMPRPHISFSNILYEVFVAIENVRETSGVRDLVGATITRKRTFKKYLDGELTADDSAQFPQDVYIIERKVKQNKNLIEFELISILDLENLLVPKRQTLDICTHRYGILSLGVIQTWATCPYAGADGYFDDEGNVATLATDKCGKKLSDCKLRYSATNDKLPFRGFPGIGSLGHPYRR